MWPAWTPGQRFVRLADISLLLHFTLDPFVYVLQRCTRRRHHGPPTPALGTALAGAAAAAGAHLLVNEPPPPPPPQSYIKKLGASLRLCGADALCSCPGSGGRDGKGKAKDGGDLSLMHYNATSASAVTALTRTNQAHSLPNSVAL